MFQYPTILHSSKAPRKDCIAFDKLDGSNMRAKWTPKKGFDLFGTRRQLVDESTPYWNEAIALFRGEIEDKALKIIDKYLKSFRQITFYYEFCSENSFAGRLPEGEDKKVILFDILCGHKNRKFVGPKDFVKYTDKFEVKRPEVIYTGKLNDSFIEDVKSGVYSVDEGVVCKGTEPTGAASGGVWMAKIKTNAWIQRIKTEFHDSWKQYI